jgi:hypothetical protein
MHRKSETTSERHLKPSYDYGSTRKNNLRHTMADTRSRGRAGGRLSEDVHQSGSSPLARVTASGDAALQDFNTRLSADIVFGPQAAARFILQFDVPAKIGSSC